MSGDLEKPELEVRFIPILCAAPLIYAHSQGIFERNGLRIHLRPAPGWSGIKELLVYEKIDAAHLLCPMAFACTLGLDGRPTPIRIVMVQNRNGHSLIVSRRHPEVRQLSALRGMRLGVPYEFSMHNYLVRHALAQSGLDPDGDVSIVEVAPPRMPQYLDKGLVDAVMSPEPWAQWIIERGHGYLLLTSLEIWDGHPCCAVAVRQDFAERYPRTLAALQTSILMAQRELQALHGDRTLEVAECLAAPAYLNLAQPNVLVRALNGKLLDGRGGECNHSHYMTYVPDMRAEDAAWMLSQMQRWGHLPGNGATLDYTAIINQVLRPDELRSATQQMGFAPRPVPVIQGEPLPLPQDAHAWVRKQPFAKIREHAEPVVAGDTSAPLRERLAKLLSALAAVTGGEPELTLSDAAADELSWLTRMLKELIRNNRFTRDALLEQAQLQAQTAEQQRIIEAQREALRQLSAPVLPLYPGIVAVPLIGKLDNERAQFVTASVLEAAVANRARVILIDITGLPADGDKQALVSLLRLHRALALLGTRCVLVGISPGLAHFLIGSGQGGDAAELVAMPDLQGGLEYALRTMGRSITREGAAGEKAASLK